MRRALVILFVLYVLACAAALVLLPASAYGWLRIERDPLSAVFAIMLAAPWSWVCWLWISSTSG